MGSQEKYKHPISKKGEHTPPTKDSGAFKDKDMQVIIGWILRAGVILSMAVVFIGGAVYLYRHGHSSPDYREFKKVPYFIHDTEGIMNGVLNLKGQAIIQLGILLLIATPIARVVFSAIGFILEKDRLYTLITLFVLFIIVVSMLTGRAG